jgi:cytochrome c oxidase subunit IV
LEQASAPELYLLFWKIVNILSTFGFKIQYVSLDGAQTNRDFAKLLIGTFKSDLIKTMTVKNIFSFKQEPIFVIMDYSHLIRR